MKVTLYGYRYSVYTWIARATLVEKGVAYDYTEINPFVSNFNNAYLRIHPFRRVPALEHNGFDLYETAAITRYLDKAFHGPCLQPNDPKELARMTQIISIIDAYAFEPMMRKAYTNRVVCKQFDFPADELVFADAMIESKLALAAINRLLVDDSEFLCGHQLSLADLHLAPVVDYFHAFDEGSEMLFEFEKISDWFQLIRTRSSIESTRPSF